MCCYTDAGFVVMISGQEGVFLLGKTHLRLPMALLFGVTGRFLISHHVFFPWPPNHLEAT